MECINYDCIGNKEGLCNQVAMKCEERIRPNHTQSYAEEQLEHAIEKEDICYQKGCSGNKENKCIVEDKICSSRLKEPINYEEEYKKLKQDSETLEKETEKESIYLNSIINKKDNEITELKSEQDILKQKLDVAMLNNKELTEKLDKANDECANYYIKWSDAGIKIKELRDESNAFEKMADILKAKSDEKDKKIEELETENKKAKEVIKKLSELL